MKRIETKDIATLLQAVRKIKTFQEDEAVIFLPIEMENVEETNENGISLNLSLSSAKKGANSLVNYGICPLKEGSQNLSGIFTAIFDMKSAILLNMNDYLQLFPQNELKDLEVLRDYECYIIKKNALAFRVK